MDVDNLTTIVIPTYEKDNFDNNLITSVGDDNDSEKLVPCDSITTQV